MESLAEKFYSMYLERDDNDDLIPDKIENAVKILNSKGYKVKFSSPGYNNTNFKNDKNDDNITYGKFVSTARVIFARDYHFNNTPQGWKWKVLENGAKALYVNPKSFDYKNGKSAEFEKWRDSYIRSLESWAQLLPEAGSDAEPKKEDEHFKS